MAKYIGTLTSDARGKVGGIVLTRARNGTNLKAHAVPRNVATQRQNDQQTTMAASLFAWRQLTDVQQVSWGAIAAVQTWRNSLAQVFVPTGLQLWTQAFSNAFYLGTTPPATAAGSPSSVEPITTVTLIGSLIGYILEVAPASGTYSGAFLIFMSAVIPQSRNYTRTISRRFIGSNSGGNFISLGYGWQNAYGPYPPNFTISNVRAVPIDPTYFYSGTEFNANIIFEP